MRSLPLFHRVAGQPVIVLGEGEAAEAKRRLVERAGALPVGEDNPDARLAFLAMEEPEEAAARLRSRGVLVNVTDRPDLCDFTVPSVLDRDPVLVAVGTSGASAGLAKQLRLRLEALLPSDLGRLAQALHAARDSLRQRFPSASERRQALDAALTQGGALDPLVEGSAKRVEGWLAEVEGARRQEPVTLFIASDDPDELTLRQARLLGTADYILFEPGISPAILDRARADAVRYALPLETPDNGQVLILRRGRALQDPAG